jgi:Raf kinase inhibitor-like YbhB/YbcL family protein
MFEKVPAGVGHFLQGVRAGYDKLVSEAPCFVGLRHRIILESTAFADGYPIPVRYTADGERIFPPLSWHGVPADAKSLVLVVEGPDALFPQPFVHLLALRLSPTLTALREGEFKCANHDGIDLGRNSLLSPSWLPPNPIAGHGPHHYVFQLFALDVALHFDRPPGRGELVEAMKGHTLAMGVLTGTYART